jgi:hypothetical protein
MNRTRDKNPHETANDTKQNIVGKARQIHAPEMMPADRERYAA